MIKILKRGEFITEVYTPKKENKEYEHLKSVNEGLLKTLFGVAKNLFRGDWDTVKCDSTEIVRAYEEMDDDLSGFTMMKLSKKDVCNKIRQELVDFASTWYEYNKKKVENDDFGKLPVRSMEFKDKTLRDDLTKCEKNIRTFAKGDEQMLKWASILKNNMKSVINNAILKEIDDKPTKEKIEDQIKEDKANRDKINKEIEKFQNEQLKAVQKEREDIMKSLGATLVNDKLTGDKVIENLKGEFDKFNNEKDKKTGAKKDKYLGLKKILSEKDFDDNDAASKKTIMILKKFYETISDHTAAQQFKEVPGQSVQAMCVAINAFVKTCTFEIDDISKLLPLMAKCAIVSDGTVGYNLPENENGDGNFFTEIVDKIAKGELTTTNKKFRAYADTLFEKIKAEAKKLKEDSEKKYKEAMKKFNIEDDDDDL